MPSGVYQHKKGYKRLPFSKKWKRKISIGHKGKIPKNFYEMQKKGWEASKGKKYWQGKKRLNISGKNHYDWKGGITPEREKERKTSEYRLWQKSVWERDNFTCQKSGIKGGILIAHHINNFAEFPELRFAIDNGITLNQKIHDEFHKKYGYRNNTKEQLREFLQE